MIAIKGDQTQKLAALWKNDLGVGEAEVMSVESGMKAGP